MDSRESIASARSRLAGEVRSDEPRTVIVPIPGSPPIVAFLVSLPLGSSRFLETRYILPLQGGRHAVESSDDLGQYRNRRALSGVLEGGQWILAINGPRAVLQSECSTNGTIHLPHESAIEPQPLAEMLRLGWGNYLAPRSAPALELREGDVLVNCYAAFAFGWMRPPAPSR